MSIGEDSVKLNILVLYDESPIHINYIKEHLECFSKFMNHNVFYIPATNERPLNFELDAFDAIIIHFCVRLAYRWHISSKFVKKLKEFKGPKVLIIQDEYDSPYIACEWIKELGIEVVFSCVPVRFRDYFYPEPKVGHVKFIQNITGYVPYSPAIKQYYKPMAGRSVVVGYRGRILPFVYGALGREKYEIGKKMKEICQECNIPHDIEWEEEERIYGTRWYEFLSNCRTILGSESGSNVVDHDGSLRTRIDEQIKEKPNLTFEEIYDKYVKEYDGKVEMNQIAPKIFEAIALKTALVLYEGNYSGIILPDIHYIPLKKDFSNVDIVLQKVKDIGYLESLTERAYADIIESGKYGYQVFVKRVEEEIISRVKPQSKKEWIHAIIGYRSQGEEHFLSAPFYPFNKPVRMDASFFKKITNDLIENQRAEVISYVKQELIISERLVFMISGMRRIVPGPITRLLKKTLGIGKERK